MTLHEHQALLLDHYKYPTYRGTLSDPDFVGEDYNPSCGDRVCIMGTVDSSGMLTQLRFSGRGCVLSQAAASLLTDHCIGKNVTVALALTKDDIGQMVGIPVGPVRLKCALLALEVLRDGLKQVHKT